MIMLSGGSCVVRSGGKDDELAGNDLSGMK